MIAASGTTDVPNVSTITDTGSRDADGVRQLHFAPPSQLGRDDVLRDPARRVARRAIDLRRILAAERAAAVTTHAAVRVDDDLAAGEPGIALRTADDESARRVDVILDLSLSQLGGNRPARSPRR